MYNDWNVSDDAIKSNATLRVDGGMSASSWTIQFLSDILGKSVDRPEILETTALGVAWLAGMQAGFYPKKEEFAKTWKLEKRFTSSMKKEESEALYMGWKDAVKRTLST